VLPSRFLRDEVRINAIQVEIDENAINLLATRQPVAADLRLVVVALKINTDLERIGDLSVHIANRAISLLSEPVIKPMVDIHHMSALVESMVRKSLDAFVMSDADMARSGNRIGQCGGQHPYRVLSRTGQLHATGSQEYSASARFDGDYGETWSGIADHTTNIAEDVLFLVKGIDVRQPQRVAPLIRTIQRSKDAPSRCGRGPAVSITGRYLIPILRSRLKQTRRSRLLATRRRAA